MADVYRHRVEYEKPRMFPVLSATVIERGDMLYQTNVGDVHPASDFTWDTTLKITQRQFARRFVGVALQQSDALKTDDIRVGTASVFQFICASLTWTMRDGVAPAADATGILLANQTVAAQPRRECQIGYVYRRHATAATYVLVELQTWPCCQTSTTTTTTTTTSTTTT